MGTRETNTFVQRAESARGAILIHVGIAILVLTALSAFVLDYGVMWLSREQAQNAADAGALAGATALAYDSIIDYSNTGPAGVAALDAAEANKVFGNVASPTVQVGRHVTNPPTRCTGLLKDTCVRVTVYRDGTNAGSAALPVYFAPLFGVTSQAISATAIAQSAVANYSSCLKPWLIPDKWQEVTAPADTFNGADVYTPPSLSSPGTGWSIADIGHVVTLKEGDPGSAISASDYYEIGDANSYQDAIEGCVVQESIGSVVNTLPGNRQGPTVHGVNDLLANGPVTVAVAMFSPVEFNAVQSPHGNFNLTIVNMMGFRITSVDNHGTVTGTIESAVGDINTAAPNMNGTDSLLKAIVLIR